MSSLTDDTELVKVAKSLTSGTSGAEILAACINNQNQIFASLQARGKIVRPLKPGWMAAKPARWQPPR